MEKNNDLVLKFEKNHMAIAKLAKSIESEVGFQIKKMEDLKAKNDEMRGAIQKAMEENNVTKFDGALITITYVKPTTKTTVDVKRFKEEKPKTYAKYLQTSAVKGSIRVKLKV